MNYDVDKLRALLPRIEEATGPNRELDVDIHKVLSIAYHYHIIHQVTSSIDAALAMIGRVLPGWHWEVGSGDNGAMLRDPSCAAFAYADHCGFAKTPPLALCAALVTTLIELQSSNAVKQGERNEN